VKIRHAFTGFTYERIDLDRVEVVDPASGRRGLFDRQARWLSGDLTSADFHLCGYVGGRQPQDPKAHRATQPSEGQHDEGQRRG
jgi:hypothetical protein